MAIHVDFACNNPNNGLPLGKFHMLTVEIGDETLEFEGPCYQSDGITVRFEDGVCSVGRLRVPMLGYKSWVGNWCWDRIAVRWPDAVKIINYLGQNKSGGWHMSCGPTELFEAFNERHAITPAEWKANNELNHLTPKESAK